MRKLSLFVLFATVIFYAFPESTKAEDESLIKLSVLLESRSYRVADKVGLLKEYSKDISAFQKLQFYDKYKSSGWWCLLNIFGGLGSWIQGDWVNGAIITGSMFGGATLANLGSKSGTPTTTVSGNVRTTVTPIEVTNAPVYYTGLTIELSGLFYGLWAPWDFENKDNARLREALGMN